VQHHTLTSNRKSLELLVKEIKRFYTTWILKNCMHISSNHFLCAKSILADGSTEEYPQSKLEPTQDMVLRISNMEKESLWLWHLFQSTILNIFQIMACGVPHWLIWRFHIYSVFMINSFRVHHSHIKIRNRIILDLIAQSTIYRTVTNASGYQFNCHDCSSNQNIACTQELRSITNTRTTHQYRHNQATHKENDCVALPDWCDHYLLYVICVAFADSCDRYLLYVFWTWMT